MKTWMFLYTTKTSKLLTNPNACRRYELPNSYHECVSFKTPIATVSINTSLDHPERMLESSQYEGPTNIICKSSLFDLSLMSPSTSLIKQYQFHATSSLLKISLARRAHYCLWLFYTGPKIFHMLTNQSTWL